MRVEARLRQIAIVPTSTALKSPNMKTAAWFDDNIAPNACSHLSRATIKILENRS
jgi:hypothetical protein